LLYAILIYLSVYDDFDLTVFFFAVWAYTDAMTSRILEIGGCHEFGKSVRKRTDYRTR
jgi:hypothetical protein